MKKADFSTLITQSKIFSAEDVAAVKSVVEKYPYFQSARALYLKGLKNTDSFKYNNALKMTAAYTTDRSVLFDYITSREFNQNAISQNIKQNTENLKALEISDVDDISINKSVLIDEALKIHIQNTDGVLDPKLFQKKELLPSKLTDEVPAQDAILDIDVANITAEETLNLGKPFDFNENETHSFAEWLKITDFKPIERGATDGGANAKNRSINQPIESKLTRIDRFIEDNPKIIPSKQASQPRITEGNSWSDEGLMTETLARIYLEQKNYDKAIQSYKILSLKYPEKSSFFADQIKAVQELQSRNI